MKLPKQIPRNSFVLAMTLRNKKGIMKDRRERRNKDARKIKEQFE